MHFECDVFPGRSITWPKLKQRLTLEVATTSFNAAIIRQKLRAKQPWMGPPPPPPSAVLMITVPRHELIEECNAIHTLNFVCQEVHRCTTRGESWGMCMPQPSFETHRRRHYKSTTGVSVAQQKGLMSYKKVFFKKVFFFLQLTISQPISIQCPKPSYYY